MRRCRCISHAGVHALVDADSGKFTQVRTRRKEVAEGEACRGAEDTEALTPKSTNPQT